MDLCLSGMLPVQIYHSFLHKHGNGCSSSRTEDENFKISDYFNHAFFSCLSEQKYHGSFRQKLPPVFLDLGRSIVEEIGEAKTYISSRGSQLRYEGMRHLFWDLQCDYFL